MTVRAVLRLGDPRLLEVSEPVHDFEDPALASLIADLWDTMATRGGVGIAAPQIGVLRRVVVFGIEQSVRYPEAPPVPRTVLVNPHITALDEDRVAGWEGCLSVPGMRGRVLRHSRIRYRGYDAGGAAFSREVSGFHARVVQHECDHLDGILYPMRIEDMRDFGFEDALAAAGRY